MNDKARKLIEIYKAMSDEQLQEEIDSIFEIVFAILEAEECDSIEVFPNTNIKLRISCEVIADGETKYYC